MKIKLNGTEIEIVAKIGGTIKPHTDGHGLAGRHRVSWARDAAGNLYNTRKDGHWRKARPGQIAPVSL
jgi:hypothetical protein